MQPSETKADERKGKRVLSARTWTLIVLVIGLALGIGLALVPRRTFGIRFPISRLSDQIDVVVSTIELSFLAALLYVYNKTYSETHARFALGVVVVLIALTFQAILTYPMFFAAFGVIPLSGFAPLVLAADIAEAVAFGIFLYLGLQ